MEHKVVSVRFDKLGKKYYFSTNGLELKLGDQVVVETIRGIELGFIIQEPKDIDESDLAFPLKPVLRLATETDLFNYRDNQNYQPKIIEITADYVKRHNLDMKLLYSEFMLDRSKLIIYFTAEGRIDFRELVKDLANEFRVRIELRQVGARDAARWLGGIGPCGQRTCCSKFLSEFQPVSIKMAKNQNLSLNPSNISGICGKLLCCINYEDEIYQESRKMMPKIGSFVNTKDGKGTVSQLNFITMKAKVDFANGKSNFYDVSEMKFKEKAIDDDLNEDGLELKELEG